MKNVKIIFSASWIDTSVLTDEHLEQILNNTLKKLLPNDKIINIEIDNNEIGLKRFLVFVERNE